MRYIRYACIALFALVLVSVALANRQMVTVRVLPEEISGLFAVAPAVELPLFVVIVLGLVAGILLGFIWEWVREHGIRAENARAQREMRKLTRENKRLKSEKHEGTDEVLALLDEAR